MKFLFTILAFVVSIGCLAQEFPETKKIPKTITKFNTSYQDDYSWLENYQAPEVKNWVDAQNLAVDKQYETIKKKYAIASKIKEYDFLSTNSFPAKKGEYLYSRLRSDKEKPAGIFYRKQLNDSPIELVNPYRIYKSNSVFITDYYPSKTSKFLAFEVSLNGSDRHEIRFINIDSKKDQDDVLHDIKFSNVSWNGDRGVFYKRNGNQNTFARDSTYQLFYHKMGSLQEADKLVFDASDSQSYISFFTKENTLFITETNKDETGINFYTCSMENEDFKPKKIIDNDTEGFQIENYSNGRIYFSSSKSDWGDIRSFDINNRADEKVVIPQIYTHLLVDSHFYKDYIVCKYKANGKNYMIVYDRDGKFVRRFDVPYSMDFTIRFFDDVTKELYVTFYSYTISFLNYKLDLETGKSSPYYNDYFPPKTALFPFDYFETKNITYKSRDNVDIPITIVCKKGTKLDGNNPTLLKAYGGFGAVNGPSYDTGLLYFLEKGGVFAFAEVRGGGEKGRGWHRDGMGLKKMNSFNDFIDAAEFLIREKYTSPAKLAITGGSQGGLLVGVALTQRPDLFKIAVPKVGVYDMMRYEQYTVGKYHLDEYGDVQNPAGFQSLLAYSPYNNVKEDVNYPITLIMTSENDDRVPPIHSYKFAAILQNRAAQKNPIYLKTASDSGHNGKVSNYENHIQEQADFYSFLLYYLN